MDEGVLGGRWTWWHRCKLMGQGPHVCSSPIFSHMTKYSFPPMFSIRGASTHTAASQTARPAWGDSCSACLTQRRLPETRPCPQSPMGCSGRKHQRERFLPLTQNFTCAESYTKTLTKIFQQLLSPKPSRNPSQSVIKQLCPLLSSTSGTTGVHTDGAGGESLPSPSLFLSLWTR